MSKLDFVLFGATGFTGKFVAKELAKKYRLENFTWAVAGRSDNKLKELLDSISNEQGVDLKHNVDKIIVDLDNPESIHQMCKKAKLVINCVGPYRFYGENVVKECVKTQTHHIDVSGEPGYLEKMQFLYDKQALDTNTYIVGSCGVDSIPADLGLAFTKSQFNGELAYVDGYLTIEPNKGKIQFNYATWISLINGLSSIDELSKIRKQLFKQKLQYSNFRPDKKSFYFYQDYLKKYAIPFFGSDKSVTYRTEYFNYFKFKKHPTRFSPYFTLDKVSHVYQVFFWGLIILLMTKFKYGRYLLLKYYKFFGRGLFSQEMVPEQLKTVCFKMHFFGKGWTNSVEQQNSPPNASIITRITGPEPSYEGTARIVTNCALVLLRENNKIQVKGGVITPAIAFSNTSLIDRLKKDGIEFENIT